MPVYFEKQAQIGILLFDEVLTKILAEYSDYSNIFLMEYVAELLKNTKMNEHAIKLEEDIQQLFKSIYSLKPVKLETLKTYIKINLANGFIWSSKFLIRAPILFDRKPDGSFSFCMDYWGFNNITIKNQYLLLLIGKLLDRLDRVKRFT